MDSVQAVQLEVLPWNGINKPGWQLFQSADFGIISHLRR